MAILVVEDEPLVRLSIVDTFEELGLEVVEASSAEEALGILAGRELCGVLTDIELGGGMNGLALAHKMREQLSDVPIVICSGHVLPLITELPRDAIFRAKPLFPDELARIGEEFLNAASKR